MNHSALGCMHTLGMAAVRSFGTTFRSVLGQAQRHPYALPRRPDHTTKAAVFRADPPPELLLNEDRHFHIRLVTKHEAASIRAITLNDAYALIIAREAMLRASGRLLPEPLMSTSIMDLFLIALHEALQNGFAGSVDGHPYVFLQEDGPEHMVRICYLIRELESDRIFCASLLRPVPDKPID